MADIEPGELIEDEIDEVYIPLERPAPAPTSVTIEYSSDSSGNDSDGPPIIKRPKGVNDPRAKYKVWTTDFSEELTGAIDRFGMETRENDRSVESYNYRAVQHSGPAHGSATLSADEALPDFYSPLGDKRNRNWKHKLSKVKQKPRILPDLEVTESNSENEIAEDICAKLFERNQEIILRVVTVLGKVPAMEFYKKTVEVEKKGGMLIHSKSRRRTSGGIFLYLVKEDPNLKADQLKDIFDEHKAKQTQMKRFEERKRRRKIAHKKNLLLSADIQNELREMVKLQSRTEAELDRRRQSRTEDEEEEEEEKELSNPPPSPATQQEPGAEEGAHIASDDGLEPPARPASRQTTPPRTQVAYDDPEDDIIDLHDPFDGMEVM